MYCTAQITRVTFLKKKISAPKIYCTILYGTIGHNPPTKLTNTCFTYDVILGVTGHQWALRNTWCYRPMLVYPLRKFTCFSLRLSLRLSLSPSLRLSERSLQITCGRKNQFLRRQKVGKHSRQTDGRTDGRRDGQKFYCTVQSTVQHKSQKLHSWKKNKRAINLLQYGTVRHKSQRSNIPKKWARPKISYFLCKLLLRYQS